LLGLRQRVSHLSHPIRVRTIKVGKPALGVRFLHATGFDERGQRVRVLEPAGRSIFDHGGELETAPNLEAPVAFERPVQDPGQSVPDQRLRLFSGTKDAAKGPVVFWTPGGRVISNIQAVAQQRRRLVGPQLNTAIRGEPELAVGTIDDGPRVDIKVEKTFASGQVCFQQGENLPE
jgi:hypothetical protein